MHEAVEDGVTEGGIADDVVPVLDGELAGDEGRATAVAVIEDLEEISALGVVEGHHAEVVESEELGTQQAVEKLGIGTVCLGESEVVEEPGEPEISGGQTMSAGGLGEGTPEVGLARAGGSGDEDDLVLSDPAAAGETKYDGLVEAARGSEVDILEAGIEAQLGDLQKPSESAVLALGGLAFEEQREPILEADGLHVGDSELLGEGLSHAGESECVEPVERGFDEHVRSSLQVVIRSPEMGMVLREIERSLWVFEGLTVESVLEDGFHGAVRGAADT